MPEPIREQVDRWPGGGGTYTAYLGLPFGAPQLVLAPANVGGRVRALLARHPSDRVLGVLPNGSPLPQTLVGGLADLGFEPTGTTPDRLAEARHDLVEFKRAR